MLNRARILLSGALGSRDFSKEAGKFAIVLAGQLTLAVAGFIILPLIARVAGPERYGDLSLFLVLLGGFSNLEVGRTIITQALPTGDQKAILSNELQALHIANVLVTTSIAFAALYLALGLSVALGGAITIALYCAAAPYFAAMCLSGETHQALSIRNVAQALSLMLTLGGVSFIGTNFPYWLPFTICYAGLLAHHFAKSPKIELIRGQEWDPRRVRKTFSDAGLLFSFNLFGILLVSLDRVILQARVSEQEFGRVSAQADLGLRMNMITNALGNFLYPIFVRNARDEDRLDREGHMLIGLVAVHALLLPIILLLIGISRQITLFFFGPEYLSGINILGIAFAAVYCGIAGFVIVPWQRARGEFLASFFAYGINAVLVVAAGFWLIRTYGAIGFVVTVLLARGAGASLFLGAIQTHLLGARRLLASFAMLAMYAVVIVSALAML